MTKVNSSPQRHTFQHNKIELEAVLEDIRNRDLLKLQDPEWQKDNLEWDLRSTRWICDKTKNTKTYAQNLYAALCNNDFQKNDVWPRLENKIWGCSWRHAGGIVADMREEGDYIDWYCSGIGSGLGNGDEDGSKGYVGEGAITDEIREDLRRLGWSVVTDSDEV